MIFFFIRENSHDILVLLMIIFKNITVSLKKEEKEILKSGVGWK